jgi:broad specificity phosphatase PhoE
VRAVETLFLARHGESEYSIEGRLNGDATVAVGLTAAGIEQARELGRTLGDVDLCVTSQMPRTRETARLALGGRDVPVEVWPELNDPTAGAYEGKHLDDFRVWAWSAGSQEPVPGGGESRVESVRRFVGAYRRLLGRPERTILAVLHALPIAYVLRALEGEAPAARMDQPVEYARVYPVETADFAKAVDVLESWGRQPTW